LGEIILYIHTIREQKEEEEYRFFRLVETGIPEVTTPSSDCFDPVVVGRRICCCCWFLMFWRIDFEFQIRVFFSTMCCSFRRKKGKSKELLLLYVGVVHLLLGYLKEPAAAKNLASSPRISLFQKNKIKRSFDGWKNFCHFISLSAPPSSSTVIEFFLSSEG
jgi:hypothetical protein